MADVVTRLREYMTLPLIGRGHRGRLIQAAMRDAAAEIERLREALDLARRELDLHDADYHHRTGAAINNKIALAISPQEQR